MKTTYSLHEYSLRLSFVIEIAYTVIHKHLYDTLLFYKCLIKLFIQTRL